jgi:uncharacterized protein (DUF885 family)
MDEGLAARLRAVHDLNVGAARAWAGLHEYDGVVQDLSPAGVSAGLARLGGEPLASAHDEAHLLAAENGLRVTFGEVLEHRWNPLQHLGNLDLSSYVRDYAPEAERADARRRHLAGWPDAVDGALESLTDVPAAVATALLPAFRGLASEVDAAAGGIESAAVAALQRLVAHLETAARDSEAPAALGGALLARLLGEPEGMTVDLDDLASRARGEAARLESVLEEGVRRLGDDRPVAEAVTALLRDHPDAHGVVAEATDQVAEVLAFTRDHDLVPHVDGVCLVGPPPPSLRMAMAMMAATAPEEIDAPSWYWVTPPDPSWRESEQDEWLQVFSRTTLPAITVHEVAPGHFAHARCLRHAPTRVRREVQSSTFAEGWAHYAEEMVGEVGFRADDPRYAIGMACEALTRVTRLECAIGLHTGAMTLADATALFESQAFLEGPAARAEAERGLFDPSYGRYTWGKLEILALREEARASWGGSFSLPRFHAALMDLGCPPLGVMGSILA